MSDKWTRCSLRISSAKRTVEGISEILKTTPSFAVNRGEPVNRGKAGSGTREFAVWILESGFGTTAEMDEHLGALFSFVESHLEGLRLLSRDCHLDLFCGFSSGSGQGGFSIKHAALKRIGEAGIDLILDLYPPEREEE